MVTISILKHSLATRLTQYLWLLSALLTSVVHPKPVYPRDISFLSPGFSFLYNPDISVTHSLGSSFSWSTWPLSLVTLSSFSLPFLPSFFSHVYNKILFGVDMSSFCSVLKSLVTEYLEPPFIRTHRSFQKYFSRKSQCLIAGKHSF